MRDNIRDYIKVGLIHFMAFPNTMKGEGPIEETLKCIARDDYFDAVEITWIKDAAIRKAAKKIIETSAMDVYYGAQPRLLITKNNPNAIDESERIIALANLKEGIDEAAEIGAKGFAFLSGIYDESLKEQAFASLIKTTVEVCEYAKEKFVPKVSLEVFDYDIDKCSLIGPVELAKKFAEEVCKKVDNFGLMVDLSHLPLLRETAEESLRPIKDYIVHAHMGNVVVKEGCPAHGDAHPRFGFPGSSNGVDELVEYLRVLLDIGYIEQGNPKVVSFEVKPFGDEDPLLVIANAKRTLNKAWSKL